MAGVPHSPCPARSLFAPPTIGGRRAPRGVLLLWLGAVVLGATACTDGGRLPGLPWSDDDSDGDDGGAGSGGIGEGEGEAAGACSALRASFDDEVWPLLQGRCLACHVADGAAGRTRLVLDPASGEHNRRLVGLLARSDVANEPLLLVKPRGGAEHGGGAVLDAPLRHNQRDMFR